MKASPRPYRDLALIRQTALEFDTLPPAGGDRPAASPRRRRQSLVRKRRRDGRDRLSQAQQAAARRPHFRRNGEGSRSVPDIIASRAVQMAGSLGVDAVQESAGRNDRKVPDEAYRARPGGRQPAWRLRRPRSAARARRTTTPTVGQRISVLGAEARSRSIRRSPASPVDSAAGRRPMRNGPSPAAMPPSRWAISRSAPRSAWPGGSASARAAATGPARRRAGGRRAAGSTRSTRRAVVRAFSPENGAHRLAGAGSRPETRPKRGPVRRRRQLRQWPGLRDQRRRRRGGARRDDRRAGLAGPPGRPAARRADHRQRQCLCRQPGQPALRAQPGRRRHALDGSGAVEIAGVFGTAAPAAAQGTVVAGFSSGELNAYRYENGRVVWQDALARTSISTTRHLAVRHRRRSGDRPGPGLRGRPGRPHGRARADHRPARLGDQRRRHLDSLGGRRLDLRRHRRGAAARRRPRHRPGSAG